MYVQKAGKKKQHKRATVLGSPVDCLTMAEAVSLACDAWRGNQVFHIVTANAEMIYAGTRDGELAKIIQAAELVTADGAGVVLASRLLACPAPERVAGYDLMVECLKKAARQQIPVYLLGAHPDVLPQALCQATDCYPGLRVVGSHHGYFQEKEEERILADIQRIRPALLLVAMGAPRQEKWIYRHKKALPPCTVMGVGGSFDVLAGKSRRAPLWMQKAGLEWFYRILKEPNRLLRARVLPVFLIYVLLQAVGLKRFPGEPYSRG